MKEGIHPNYQQTTIKCACGNVIETGSTKKDIKVEICSKCHPFYTGKQKLVDTSGAGDAFLAGFVAARSRGYGLEKAVQAASRLAAEALAIEESVAPKMDLFEENK